MGASDAASVSSGASRSANAVGNVVGRAGTAVSSAGQQVVSRIGQAASSQLGRSVIANASVGSGGNMLTYAVTTAAEDHSLWGIASAGAGGFVSGSLGGFSDSASSVSNTLARGLAQNGFSGGGNVAGGMINGVMSGDGYSLEEGVVDLIAGSAMAHIPGLSELGAPNAGQGAHFAQSFAEQRLSWGVDIGKEALESQGIIK